MSATLPTPSRDALKAAVVFSALKIADTQPGTEQHAAASAQARKDLTRFFAPEGTAGLSDDAVSTLNKKVGAHVGDAQIIAFNLQKDPSTKDVWPSLAAESVDSVLTSREAGAQLENVSRNVLPAPTNIPGQNTSHAPAATPEQPPKSGWMTVLTVLLSLVGVNVTQNTLSNNASPQTPNGAPSPQPHAHGAGTLQAVPKASTMGYDRQVNVGDVVTNTLARHQKAASENMNRAALTSDETQAGLQQAIIGIYYGKDPQTVKQQLSQAIPLPENATSLDRKAHAEVVSSYMGDAQVAAAVMEKRSPEIDELAKREDGGKAVQDIAGAAATTLTNGRRAGLSDQDRHASAMSEVGQATTTRVQAAQMADARAALHSAGATVGSAQTPSTAARAASGPEQRAGNSRG